MSMTKALANLYRAALTTPAPEDQSVNHMPPLDGETTQTPEVKSVGGLASVFKNLTSGRSTKNSLAPNALKSAVPAATVQLAQQLQSIANSPDRIYGGPDDYDNLVEQVHTGHTASERIKAADSLCVAIREYPLTGISKIWHAGKRLIDPAEPTDLRHAGFRLLTACVQKDASDLERKEYFDTLTKTLNVADFNLQISAFTELARNGRNLAGFHYDVFPLLTTWLRSAFETYDHARKLVKLTSTRPGSAKAIPEEKDLLQVFDLVVNIIKFSFNVASEEETSLLIEVVLHIAMQARSPTELESCIRVLDTIITFGTIPADKLSDCIGVLCTIHSLVSDVRKEAWNTFGNLCRSHDGHRTITILLDIVQHSERRGIREVRGALAVLTKIHAKNGRKQYPIIPHDLLFEALETVVATQPGKVDNDVLRLVLDMFSKETDDEDNDKIFEHDWALMLNVATNCAARATVVNSIKLDQNGHRSLSPTPSTNTSDSHDSAATTSESITLTLLRLITKLEELMLNASDIDILQRLACMKFFASVQQHLPESCAKLVIEAYDESKACYPSHSDWKDNIQKILDGFFRNRRRSYQVRLLALRVITDVYEVINMIETNEEPSFADSLVSCILSSLIDETDTQVLKEVVGFAVAVAENAEIEVFKFIMQQLRDTISHGQSASPLSSPKITSTRPTLSGQHGRPSITPTTSAANIVTRGIVQIFMRAMDNDAEKAVQTYEEILRIVKTVEVEVDARISAMKLLFRIRADWADRVFITPFTESEGLAASLYRTAASLARKHADDESLAQQTGTRIAKNERVEESGGIASNITRSIRSLSSQNLTTLASLQKSSGSVKGGGTHRSTAPQKQMWMTPDPDALPSHVSGRASVLFASWETEEDAGTANLPADRRVLRIYAWLEIVNTLLQEGCHWEIYAYILVHLSAQLGNPGVFKAATIQVRELRKILCEQISRGVVHEPPLASGLRRADVAICVFQTLTMLISYHEHFHRPEEDDIVKSFVAGLTGWEKSAKCCVHALSICCHELPNSMRSSLFPTLQKMSQIVTQASIAVHVLEYLACLSRLPELYSNFREDEYKFVFGICFRFLQSVRERNTESRQPSRHSGSQHRQAGTSIDARLSIQESESGESNFQPNTSDDLPQYVYALAYHVIIFWFLALRLSDRGNQVSWLIKNLVGNDEFSMQQMDEQAEIVIDFMQRTAYANVDESKANPDFVPEKYGEILKRRWLVGKSIITIEQAKDNDWAQITKRQPSATSHYMIHERFERPPAHQMLSLAGDSRHAEANMVLPNYLLLQLGSTFTMSENSRPIPLPDDDTVKRAIGSFDRIPTIDGHKVGVIYIGENQSDEVEILANVMGSSDYTTFLEGLGTLTRLEGATFNTQGLDRQYNTDGKYTFCWRDRVTEIVFHVPTLMPTDLENDKQCTNKKRHIGNDFVNIIFNNSGTPFKFDTFPSDFNFVNIVITPESRASFVARRARSDVAKEKAFYRVQVMSKPGFPEISPAAETKLVSLRALPDFIRLLALNASVFSLVWANRTGGEHVSSWRNRLRAIKALRTKYGDRPSTGVASSSSNFASAGHVSGYSNLARQDSRPDTMMNSRRASVATSLSGMTVTSDDGHLSQDGTQRESVFDTVDFSKWA